MKLPERVHSSLRNIAMLMRGTRLLLESSKKTLPTVVVTPGIALVVVKARSRPPSRSEGQSHRGRPAVEQQAGGGVGGVAGGAPVLDHAAELQDRVDGASEPQVQRQARLGLARRHGDGTAAAERAVQAPA